MHVFAVDIPENYSAPNAVLSLQQAILRSCTYVGVRISNDVDLTGGAHVSLEDRGASGVKTQD